jgi:mannose-6-phosphate isomerase
LDRDTALSAVDTTALADPDRLIRHTSAVASELVAVLPADAAPYFRMELLTADAEVPAGFAIAVVLAGSGVLTSEHGAPLDVAAGQTLVVPAAGGGWRVDGDARLLVCRPGTTWPPNRTQSWEGNS